MPAVTWGVNLANTGAYLKDKVELSIGDNVNFLDTTTRLLADSIAIKKKTTVYDVTYNELDNKGTILGVETPSLTTPYQPLPPLPVDFAPGTEMLEVKKDNPLQLEPGSYGELNIKKDAVVTLSGGLYHFQSWKLENAAAIYVQKPSEIRITGGVEIKKEGFIGPDPDMLEVTAGDIIVYVVAPNGKKGDIKGKPAAVDIGDKSTVQAYIVAPNGAVLLGKEVDATGAFIGRWVDVQGKVLLANDATVETVVAAGKQIQSTEPLSEDDADEEFAESESDAQNVIFLPFIALPDSPSAVDETTPAQEVKEAPTQEPAAQTEADTEEVDAGEAINTEMGHQILLPLIFR